MAQQHEIDLHLIFQGDVCGGSFGEGDPVGEEEGPGAASASGVCSGALYDPESESGDSRIENDPESESDFVHIECQSTKICPFTA